MTTPANLSGLFKEVYGDSVENLIPEAAKIIRQVPFVQKDKEIGNKYHQPVIVSQEHGVTYAAYDAGAFALKAAVSMQTQDAQVSSSQILLRSSISYDAAARASNSKKAFVGATQLLVENMMESITKRVEVACWYGGSGLATTSSSSNVDTTHTTITFTAASWASGIWAGAENCKLNFYTSVPGLVSSSTDAIFTITAVDVENRTLTVSGTTTGISALDSAIGSGACTVWYEGSYGNEMSGVDKIVTNTGTLFNISATTYNLWRGNTYSAASAELTFGKIMTATSKGVQRGLNETAVVYVNPDTWSNLMADMSALRRIDGSYSKKKLENGAEAISFYAQNGMLDVVPHNIIKAGEAFIFPSKRLTRIGAQDISFKTPGRGEDIFTQLADNAGFELRVYTDQAIFCETPARMVKITNIVNS